jgi:hypothetical protein
MAELTVPNGTSVGMTRLGRPARATVDALGPLADLVGVWLGNKGWELIAVPDGDKGFRVIAQPYLEVLSISAIGAVVPNRGGPVPDMFINGLMYSTRITELTTHEPLHLENGMWLLMDEGPDIARLASIPHGDVLLAIGSSTTSQAAPVIPVLDAMPDIGPKPLAGYAEGQYGIEPRGHVPPGFDPTNANKTIQDDLEGLNIVETVEISVSSAQHGGVLNIPYVDARAKATKFACTYWIETIEDPTTNQQVMQLQYSQQTDIEFLPQFGNTDELIMWPHVNVNTLRKQ